GGNMQELSPERAEFLARDYSQGFIAFCRFEPESVAWGQFASSLAVQDFHRQQDGFIHAGVLATMADHTAGYAGFTVAPENHQILTVEFKINFLRPSYGQTVICESSVLKPGKTLIVAESNLWDQRGENRVQTARATVTLMAVAQEELARGGK
ncbi:MAG: PaaI family thioesterase, partial [Desulfovermiculus sp.]